MTWVHVRVLFHDGDHVFQWNVAFPMPTTQNLPYVIELKINCRFNPVTALCSVDAVITHRESMNHTDDNNPEAV
jgi:hypothetical protein